MKKLIVLVSLVLLNTSIIAQTPDAFKYQAIARDTSGSTLQNQNISIKISILSGNTTGSVEYSETHTMATNKFGLFSLNIGSGTIVSGSFSTINWGSNTHFVKVDMDASGGSNYQHMGTSQLLSVPYSLYSDKAGNVIYSDTSATNEIQILSIHNDTMHITNGNFVNLDIDRNDRDSTNELQTISISNDTIFLSGSGFVKLPLYQGSLGNTGISSDCGSIFTQGSYVYNSSSYYYSPSINTTSDSFARWPIPENGYMTNLHIYPVSIPDSGSSMSVTLMKNGVATSLSVSHSSFDGMNIKFDTITKVNLKRGDLISIKTTAGIIPPMASYRWSYEFKCYSGHYVGELYGGGIVFHTYKDNIGLEHGLIASLADLSQSSEWGLNGTDVSNCESTWNGQANTNAILSAGGLSTDAAGICDSFNGGGFTDWYLPSIDELKMLDNNSYTINKALSTTTGASELETNHYWSSMEVNSIRSWYYLFGEGFLSTQSKTMKYWVRAVRAF